MLRIIYDPLDGEAVADGKASEWVSKRLIHRLTTNGDLTVTVGTEVMINEFRLAVVDKKIKPEEMVFIFKDHILTIREGGRINKWPCGFCDTLVHQLARM